MSNNYTSKDIKTMSDIDGIRKRPSMYVGETVNPAHLFQEVFDNALDESIGGYAKLVTVNVNTEENVYTVSDNGRGIPLGKMKIDIFGMVIEKESLEVLFTKNHAGGKFEGSGYKITSGLHGVGLKCIAALSSRVDAKVERFHEDLGYKVSGNIAFEKGKLVEHDYIKVDSKKTGTSVSFSADPEIFNSVAIPMSYIINKCKLARAFGHNVELKVDGELIDLGKSDVSSLLDFENTNPMTIPITSKVSNESGEFFISCIQYAEDISMSVKGFTNMLYNSQGGTHNRLFERAVIDAWKRVLPKEILNEINDRDMLIGLRSVIAVFIQKTAFSSQTKERLIVHNNDISGLMKNLEIEISNQLRKNPELVDKLGKKFLAFRRAQNAMLNNKEIRGAIKVAEVSKDGKVRRRSVVPGLVECTNPIVGETELFITEGDSALGSIRQARDSRIHGGLALRGKCLNVADMDFVQAMRNQEMLNIVNAIGAGLGEESDPKKSRYGKIIVTADADMDGLHICNLVVSAMINLLPNLVKAGMVYIAPGYLFGYYLKDGSFHGCNKIEEIPKEAKSYTRFKGLGELNPDQFFKFYMDKDSRYLQQVEYPESIEDFNRIMTQSKRSLLEEEEVIVSNR